MGCDIHTHAERKNESGAWEKVMNLEPFSWRNYGMFGFLADVRNYSDVPPIAQPRGFPSNASGEVKADYDEWGTNTHNASWLSIEELAAFDYDATTEDRRVTRQIAPNVWNGGCTCEPGEGRQTTFREFLGERFFNDLQALQEAKADRVVFWFDN